MRSVSFYVPGTAAPQGSLVRTRYGVRDANKNTRPWKGAVAEAAYERMLRNGCDGLLSGPIAFFAEFNFARPKSHYRTGRHAGLLRAAAPRWHEQTPDADKLARAIGDALSGVVFRDDAQIAQWEISKRWAEVSGAYLQIWELEDEEVV